MPYTDQVKQIHESILKNQGIRSLQIIQEGREEPTLVVIYINEDKESELYIGDKDIRDKLSLIVGPTESITTE